MRRLFSVLIGLLACAQPASAWQQSREVGYPAAADCPSENMCLMVACPAPGKPSFEMLVFEHGKAVGEPFVISVDGQRFDFRLPETEANGVYRWALRPDFVAALQGGRTAAIHFDPQGQPHQVSLRGSGAAIGRVMAACGRSGAMPGAATTGAASGALSGLSAETMCQPVRTSGVVVERKLDKGGALSGFTFQDDSEVTHINVELPDARQSLAPQLMQILTPGARLRLELLLCGASGTFRFLSAVEPAS